MANVIDTKYQEIEGSLATVEELERIPVQDCGEPLVPIRSGEGIIVQCHSPDMDAYTGKEAIYVRESVRDRLKAARRELRGGESEYQLKLMYGYRALQVQRKYHAMAKGYIVWTDLISIRYPTNIRNRAHWIAAYPPVAGHVTGGAVDVTVHNLRTKTDLDMGTDPFKVKDVGRKMYRGSPEISEAAGKNRGILSDAMESQGFYPFAGEYWHFSYGDREWAWGTGSPQAIYAPIPFSAVRTLLIDK